CLDNEGYQTEVAHDGKTALSLFHQYTYDLILLDRMLPDVSGEEICKQIRQQSDIPIIMLTAKIEDEDRIEGFQLGCDDYICKPFNIMELLLRIKAILKRTIKKDNQDLIKFGTDFELNTLSHQLKVKGQEVPLTNTEYKILLALSSHPQKVYTREELLAYAVDGYVEKFDRVIDSHIKNLRHKIEIDSIILTVYGVGYRFGLQK
ncbi:MAG: response regulator transcription factor, partial [Turicibacter sanguinis]